MIRSVMWTVHTWRL